MTLTKEEQAWRQDKHLFILLFTLCESVISAFIVIGWALIVGEFLNGLYLMSIFFLGLAMVAIVTEWVSPSGPYGGML